MTGEDARDDGGGRDDSGERNDRCGAPAVRDIEDMCVIPASLMIDTRRSRTLVMARLDRAIAFNVVLMQMARSSRAMTCRPKVTY